MDFRKDHSTDRRVTSLIPPVLAGIKAGLSGTLFWLAVVLPLLYVPLFVAGLDSPSQTGLFLSLIVVHLVALLGGHSYYSN